MIIDSHGLGPICPLRQWPPASSQRTQLDSRVRGRPSTRPWPETSVSHGATLAKHRWVLHHDQHLRAPHHSLATARCRFPTGAATRLRASRNGHGAFVKDRGRSDMAALVTWSQHRPTCVASSPTRSRTGRSSDGFATDQPGVAPCSTATLALCRGTVLAHR